MMRPIYRAAQVAADGRLEIVNRPTRLPGAGEVLIAVEACGMCGADMSDIAQAAAAPERQRVPGHEIVGRIAVIGTQVPAMWQVGQRVGLGRLGGPCNACAQCRRGRFQLCQDQPVVGVSCDGGYAEMVVARASGLVSIPDELGAGEAAPILCAGVATYNAMMKTGAQPGDTVAVFGIGGLGHMAVQYARKMGYRVVAIGRGQEIAADVLALGAHHYVDTDAADATAELQRLGGAQAIVSTVMNSEAVSALVPALVPEGRMVLLGVGKEPVSVPPRLLVGGERQVLGSITGSPYENERVLRFSVLVDARPKFEAMPLDRVNEAVERLKQGDVKFRLVLTM